MNKKLLRKNELLPKMCKEHVQTNALTGVLKLYQYSSNQLVRQVFRLINDYPFPLSRPNIFS